MNPYLSVPTVFRWFRSLTTALLLLAPSLFMAPALAGTITTYAGGGLSTADNIPATAAQLITPQGLAVDLAGNLFIADFDAFVVRKVDAVTGIITTVAGNGTFGDLGDNGPATAASLAGPIDLAVDLTGNLYLIDYFNNRIRRVDAVTGTITAFAGNGQFGLLGDGGPATAASLNLPEGLAVDAAGNVYIADTANCAVRRVDAATGIITTIAGGLIENATLICASSDYALTFFPGSRAFANPRRLAIDVSQNLYVAEVLASSKIHKIDAVTGMVTTVAGGGAGNGDSGLALAADLSDAKAIAVDDFGGLYIGMESNLTGSRVLKVDLAGGTIQRYAGNGLTNGFSGDGGPAVNAELAGIGGLAVAGNGDLYLSDAFNHRVRKVAADTPAPFDIIVDLGTSQAVLDPLTTVQGSVLLINVDGRNLLVLPNLTGIGLDLTVTGNATLTDLLLPWLASVGGNLTVANNPVLGAVNLGSLGSVGGSVSISGNAAATTVVTPSLGSVGGSVDISNNPSLGNVTIGSAASVATIGGSVTLSGNTAASSVDTGSVGSIGGSVTISGNTAATTVGMPSVGSIGGSVSITGNTSATSVTTGSVGTIGGDVTITGNGNATVATGSIGSIGGSVAIETQGQTTFDISQASVGGSVSISATSATEVSAQTGALGSTGVTMANGPATMRAELAAGTFTTPAVFSITQQSGPALNAVTGTDALGAAALIDPVAAYTFAFAIPTLNQNARLTFDIAPAGLPVADRDGLLAAVAGGVATIGVQGDAVGSVYQSFPLCPAGGGSNVALTAGGCVLITLLDLDANGNEIPAVDPANPGLVRLSGLVGHFSTWAVVIATPIDVTPPLISGVPADLTATASGPSGAVVTWTGPTAFDLVSGNVAVTCVPASGALFGVGTTPVTCSASDAAGNSASAVFFVTVLAAPPPPPPANTAVLYATLGTTSGLPDLDAFSFRGVKGEKVTVRLAVNPAGVYTNGQARLSLLGYGVLKSDATTLPNVVTATLPKNGTYLVTVSELLKKSGKFKGAYQVSLQSSKNAWTTFVPR